MAAEKEPFLVPAPPPPLKDESGGGGGPGVQPHREAASGEPCGGTERSPGPCTLSVGPPGSGTPASPRGGPAQPQRGGGPQAQPHGEARLAEPHGRAAPQDVGEERRGGAGTELGPPAPPGPEMATNLTGPPGEVGAREEIAVMWEEVVAASNIRPLRDAGG